jgi:hypothetical protein
MSFSLINNYYRCWRVNVYVVSGVYVLSPVLHIYFMYWFYYTYFLKDASIVVIFLETLALLFCRLQRTFSSGVYNSLLSLLRILAALRFYVLSFCFDEYRFSHDLNRDILVVSMLLLGIQQVHYWYPDQMILGYDTFLLSSLLNHNNICILLDGS